MSSPDEVLKGLYDETVVGNAPRVLELTKETQIFATNLGSWVLPGSMCAALYLAMSLPLSALARRLERQWKSAAV